jgi:site-specific DNA-methyltransferase (cytosine-N4-specific)
MQRLLQRGYRAKERPSGHRITQKFKDNGGSIPPNVIICGNNDANGHYLSRCSETGRKPHPARFPAAIPLFFVRFLTDPGDMVLDPFAGSNTTGEVCEAESRRWIAVELDEDYLETSKFRFEPHEQHLEPATANGAATSPKRRGRKRKPADQGQPDLFGSGEQRAG